MCFRGRFFIVSALHACPDQTDPGRAVISGNPDAHHMHDFKRHTAHGFTARIIGQVNALTLDIPVGLLALEPEGRATTLNHERIDNPVTLGPLHM